MSRPIEKPSIRALMAAAVLLTALGFPGPLSAADSDEVSSGVLSFNRGHYTVAAQTLARELQSAPGDLGLRLTYAVSLLQLKNYGEAALQLERALALAPSASILRDLQTSALRETKAARQGATATMKTAAVPVVINSAGVAGDASIAVLRQVALEHPSSAPVANLLGDAFQLSGNASAAEQWYRKAAGLAPNWTKPLVGLALAVLDTDPTRSANLLEDVIRRDPSNAQAKLWLGDAYRRTGRPDMAERYYLQAAEDPLTRADALVRRGTQYMGQNQVTEAGEQFSQAQAADPGNLPAAVGMAQTQVLQNDFGQAQKTAEGAAEQSRAYSPATQATVYLNAAQVAQAAGNYDEAGLYFGTANRLDPDAQSVYAEQADMYARQGSITGWNFRQEEQLAQSPDDIPAMRRLAEGYRAAGQPGKRLAIVEKLTRADPANAWLWRLQGAESLWALGRKDEACDRWLASVDAGYPTRTIRIADSIGSQAGAAGYVLSRLAGKGASRNGSHLLFALQRREGHLQEALKELDRVIALDPDNVTLIGQRGWLLGAMGRKTESEEAFRRQRELTRAKQ